MNTLNKINSYQDFLDLDESEYQSLSNDIRAFIIELAKTKEIHYGSNLGIVELTISLLSNFNLNNDVIVYDTGHQSYVHKILTGRKDLMHTIRTTNGLSAFTDMKESKYDFYSPGHSGNTISVLGGMNYCNHDKTKYHVCVIGDSSLNTGLSFEGLNLNSFYKIPNIIVVNDNQMSISEAVGSLNKSFNNKSKAKGYFKALGYEYIGIIDGHDFKQLNKAFKKAKALVDQNKTVVVHTKTIKAKGDKLGESDKLGYYHANTLKQSETFGEIACNNLLNKIKNDKDLYILNPAMNVGTGFMQLYNQHNAQYLDMGISEEHVSSFASGLCLKNKKVVCLYYSSFIQRAYDQLVHDLSRLNLKPIFLLDRADLSGGDGPSHHGIFDVGFLKSIPNAKIYSPRNYHQLNTLIDYAYNNISDNSNNDLIFIRYPKSKFTYSIQENNNDININEFEYLIDDNNSTAIITYGPYTDSILECINNNQIKVDLINTIAINKLNPQEIKKILSKYSKIICYERIYSNLGLVNEFYDCANQINSNTKIISMSYKQYPTKGSTKDIDLSLEMDVKNIFELV